MKANSYFDIYETNPRPFDLQRFEGEGGTGDGGEGGEGGTGDGGTGEGGDTGPKKDATATERMVDPKTKKNVFVTPEVKELITNSIGRAKSEVREETEKRITGLRNQVNEGNPDIEELRKKITDLEDEQLPAKEKEAVKAKRAEAEEVTRRQKIEKERDKFRGDYENLLVKNSIHDGLSDHKLHNTRKTVNALLLDSKVELDDVLGDDGKATGEKDVFLTMMLPDETGTKTRQRLRPKEAIAKWITLPEQANELTSSLVPGSGASTPGSGQGPTNSAGVSRKDLSSSPSARKQFVKDLVEGKDPKIQGNALAG